MSKMSLKGRALPSWNLTMKRVKVKACSQTQLMPIIVLIACSHKICSKSMINSSAREECKNKVKTT